MCCRTHPQPCVSTVFSAALFHLERYDGAIGEPTQGAKSPVPSAIEQRARIPNAAGHLRSTRIRYNGVSGGNWESNRLTSHPPPPPLGPCRHRMSRFLYAKTRGGTSRPRFP